MVRFKVWSRQRIDIPRAPPLGMSISCLLSPGLPDERVHTLCPGFDTWGSGSLQLSVATSMGRSTCPREDRAGGGEGGWRASFGEQQATPPGT